MKVRIKLAPIERQRRFLDVLFAWPEKLCEMMSVDRPSIECDADLYRYLNKHKHELYSTLGPKSWEHCVDFLKESAKRFLERRADELETEPVPGCSISLDNKIYIPLDGILFINAENPQKIGEAKIKWRLEKVHYKDVFTLLKSNGKYYCEFLLTKREENFPKPGQLRKRKPRPVRVGHLSIAKLCQAIAKAELAESKAYSRVNFDDLQGRSVAGGAIEHGKKNR